MRDAVICEPIRTPVGRYGGALRDLEVAELAAGVVREVIARTGIPPAQVDDVLLGQCYPSGEAPALGRVAALDAGLPVSVPGAQIDRRCGSALMAVITAAMQVQTGAAEVVLAGGAESMSQTEFYSTTARWAPDEAQVLHDRLARARVTAGGVLHPVDGGMIETAENLRKEYGISREEQDRLAYESHQRAIAAAARGAFDDEIVPVRTASGTMIADEGPRPGTTLDKLGTLSPLFVRQDADATVTAGNACGQSDGAAICVVTHRDRADELGLRPLARLAGWAVAGVAPDVMGIGPVPASARVLERLDLDLADMDLIELNEAFAAQVLACTTEWKFADADFERLNPLGSGISLGHPVGATGVRILATMLRELDRRDGRYGLETMCIGGGQGIAAVFERLP